MPSIPFNDPDVGLFAMPPGDSKMIGSSRIFHAIIELKIFTMNCPKEIVQADRE